MKKAKKAKNSINFNINKPSSYKKYGFIASVLIILATLVFAYSNHFSNSFHFDDNHTIENNIAIQEINITHFFTDATTISSLPANQTYRPLTTLENAIDYKIAGGLNTEIFHIHIFLKFLMVCILIGVFVKKLLDKTKFSEYNQYWALLNVAFFGLLCANAETVNYIIQRAEITAALYILAGFAVFISGGFWRSKFVYLLFPFIGFFAKEMALTFAPLLLLYVLIFEEQVDLLHFYKKKEFKKTLKSFYKALPSFILTITFYIFYTSMVPSTFSPGGLSRFNYLITQPMVIVHYIVTYFIPYNLSADSDWVVYTSIFDYRVLAGVFIISLLLFTALKASKNKDTRLFSFGILWFFLSLLPTSSLIPLAEVLNDHRSFIPYIGLTIAFIFGVNYLLQKYVSKIINKRKLKNIMFIGILIFLAANVYGIRQRNKVWNNGLSLWKDVTIKSPNNGRGFLNYGLALMTKGDFVNAEKQYKKALILNPNYSIIYINLGIVKNAMGYKNEADNYFKKSLELSPLSHNSLFYYARFLNNNNQTEEAKKMLIDAIRISPSFPDAKTLLMNIYHKTGDWEKLKNLAQEILKKYPNNTIAKNYFDISLDKKSVITIMEEDAKNAPTPEKYLNLSLHYFQTKKFKKTISAAKLAIKFNEKYAEAYNNIGIAHYMLGEYDLAIEAYNKALNIKPNYSLSKSNLANVIEAKKVQVSFSVNSNKKLTSNDFLNLSLTYYNEGNFIACIEAAKKSNNIFPNSVAFNNICAAYNKLKEFDKAIKACNEAIKLDANNILAKGNLNVAIKSKS